MLNRLKLTLAAKHSIKMILADTGQQRTKAYWVFLGLILLIIIWCANPWQLYFFNDDFLDIPISYDGTTGHHHSLRHINDFSFYLDSLLSKENAVGYHITNLLLYIANIVLGVFLLKNISRSLQAPFSTPMAILIAALFGTYAFHSEALFWVICRTASLSFFFNTICWLCLFKSVDKRIWLLPAAVFFLLGIFTYEAVWVLPFWLLLWYFLLPARSVQRKQAILPVGLIWLLFILYFPIRIAVTGELLGSYEAGDVQEAHVLPIIEKTFKLFARSFLPPVYSHRLFLLLFVGVLAALLLWAKLLWKNGKNNKLIWFFTAAWLISYFPYVSLGISTTGYASERYLYFPSFFLCALLVYGGSVIWQNTGIAWRLFVVALFAYHLLFFVKAAQVFKKVSSYSFNAIKAMRQVPLQKQIIMSGLPTYSHGIPVFNYGFPSAVRWQVAGRDTSSVQVLSTRNFENQPIDVKSISSNSKADTILFFSK